MVDSNNLSDIVEFQGVTLARLTQIAVELHARLPRRVVIALRGTLGAGKTRFAQSIAVAAGVDVADVTSPTFTIVQHYRGLTRLIHHIDAYRLADEDEFAELGGDELMESDAMILVEWPDRIAGCLPRRVLEIELEIESGSNDPAGVASGGANQPRRLRITSSDAGLMRIARELAESIGETAKDAAIDG